MGLNAFVARMALGGIFVVFAACTGSNFKASDRRIAAPTACVAGQDCNALSTQTPQPTAATGGSSAGGSDRSTTGSMLEVKPQPCDSSTLKMVQAGSSCPDGSAVYGIDDPSSGQALGSLACCPLPALDILQSPAVSRPQKCGAGEVMVGNDGGSNVSCRAINSAVYKVTASNVHVCYFGSGSSGQGNAPRCGTIPSELNVVIGTNGMGSDGCLNFPYGSLSVGQSGRNCSDQTAVQLLKLDGSMVPMFK